MSNHSELQAERERLTSERQLVLVEIGRLRESLQIEPELELDEGDPEYVVREQNLALLRNFEERLQEIDIALEELDTGSYGICKRCGQPIDPERLRIMPEATLCVPCKSELEKRRRMSAR
ncbi:MAG: TraR/DksA C4-type zinc finger protein [Ardenticatenaceae bacterium]|nr:TraR/DksA C4-type zinc finger protein [Ardenticatenaceae bacterium]HBY93781.1 conjugal transfer protein TraR [Chloroflexota bacterium]